MAPRIRPGESSTSHEDVGRLASRPDNQDKPVQQPRQDPNLPHRRQRGEIEDGFGQPVKIKPFGGCELSYREKQLDSKGWHRKYYFGYVQFAFVRKDPDGYIVHLTGQDDAPSGQRFHSVDEVDAYLRSQLVLGDGK